MRHRTLAGLLIAAVGGTVWIAVQRMTPNASASSPAASPPILAERLEVRELFKRGSALLLSEKARRLDGHRVRLVGFMAEMEQPPEGALYLVPNPLHCDEAGGGTADLPPESVLVPVPSAGRRPVPFIRGPLEADGVLETGNRTDPQGRASNFRLRIDPAPESLRTDATSPGGS
jgi:hypothetical protein